MIQIPGYTLAAPVCEVGDVFLYQAIRALDGMPVLLKVPAAPRPTPAILRRLEHEYELARDLVPDLIAWPLALERYADTIVLVLEHGPHRTLTDLLGSPMDILSFLKIALGITAALAEICGHELFHKDLKPENVLLNAAGHARITGLGIASRLPRKHLAPEPPEVIAGTLAYMAPEQTGRMNRSIDSRSDLYALGVIFYQMLTGVLPFTADDPMEWFHCHIARQLEQRYPQLREASSLAPTGTSSTVAGEIDALAIVQASRAISSEILLDHLIETLMRTVLTTAGAQKGYLLLTRKEELTLAAFASVEEQNIVTQVRTDPGFPKTMLPVSILNYVRRSRDKVLLDDATSPNPYSADEYFSHRRQMSVLCLPIIRQTELIGALYLENDLATHAFTPDRVAVLELLATQAAISLENALVYEALRASERRYRMSQDIGHVGNWEYNIRTTQFWVSDESKHIYGFDPAQSDFSTEEVEKCIPERERVHQALVDLIEKGKPYNLEFEIHPRESSGSKIIASTADVQRDEHGNPQVVLGVIHDITERKRAEEKIRQLNQILEQRVLCRTAQLEAANKELEAFAYSVSHDLRAPLRHIVGFMELIKKKTETVLDDQSHHYMETISNAANKMGQLIDDLLSFSRMGRSSMSVKQLELDPLVREVIRDLEPDVAGRNIDWRIGDLPVVGGDAAMLRMVLVNLISNALKFTGPREQAQIEIGSLPGRDGEATFFVGDNGVGFDMTYVDKLFGVFHRLHRTEEFEGTGIGLANVHRIIARHGGRTWAEGKVDQGATFFFSLPHSPPKRGDALEVE